MRIRSALVLDTGPLFDYLVLRHQSETQTQWWGPHQPQDLRTPADRNNWEKALGVHVGRVFTSSGVVAELQAHLLKAEKSGRDRRGQQQPRAAFRRQIWTVLRDCFDDWQVDERAVPLRQLSKADLCDLGSVDAGLVELTKRIHTEFGSAVLLTADGRLMAKCAQADLSAEWASEWATRFVERGD